MPLVYCLYNYRRFDPGLLAVVTPEEIILPSPDQLEKDREYDEFGSCSFSMSERSMEWDEMRQRASTSTNSCPIVTEIPVLLLYFIYCSFIRTGYADFAE